MKAISYTLTALVIVAMLLGCVALIKFLVSYLVMV